MCASHSTQPSMVPHRLNRGKVRQKVRLRHSPLCPKPVDCASLAKSRRQGSADAQSRTKTLRTPSASTSAGHCVWGDVTLTRSPLGRPHPEPGPPTPSPGRPLDQPPVCCGSGGCIPRPRPEVHGNPHGRGRPQAGSPETVPPVTGPCRGPTHSLASRPLSFAGQLSREAGPLTSTAIERNLQCLYWHRPLLGRSA